MTCLGPLRLLRAAVGALPCVGVRQKQGALGKSNGHLPPYVRVCARSCTCEHFGDRQQWPVAGPSFLGSRGLLRFLLVGVLAAWPGQPPPPQRLQAGPRKGLSGAASFLDLPLPSLSGGGPGPAPGQDFRARPKDQDGRQGERGPREWAEPAATSLAGGCSGLTRRCGREAAAPGVVSLRRTPTARSTCNSARQVSVQRETVVQGGKRDLPKAAEL